MQISVRVYELSCVGEYLLITAKLCGLVNMAGNGLLLNQWALVISIIIFRIVTPDNNQPIVIL